MDFQTVWKSNPIRESAVTTKNRAGLPVGKSYDDENTEIETNKSVDGQHSHVFSPAEWMLPDGSRRCVKCGEPEPVGNRCQGLAAKSASEKVKRNLADDTINVLSSVLARKHRGDRHDQHTHGRKLGGGSQSLWDDGKPAKTDSGKTLTGVSRGDPAWDRKARRGYYSELSLASSLPAQGPRFKPSEFKQTMGSDWNSFRHDVDAARGEAHIHTTNQGKASRMLRQVRQWGEQGKIHAFSHSRDDQGWHFRVAMDKQPVEEQRLQGVSIDPAGATTVTTGGT